MTPGDFPYDFTEVSENNFDIKITSELSRPIILDSIVLETSDGVESTSYKLAYKTVDPETGELQQGGTTEVRDKI